MASRAPRPKLTALLAVVGGSVVWALAQAPTGTTPAARPETARPELVPQTGHTGAVLSVAFSPDGRWLASGGTDNTVNIWDLVTERQFRTLSLGGVVYAVTFDGVSRWLATYSSLEKRGRVLRYWDPYSGREIPAPTSGKSDTIAIAFSPDFRQVALSGEERIKIWDTTSGAALRTLASPGYLRRELAWSPDSRWLASVGFDTKTYLSTVRLWDMTSEAEGRNLEDPGIVPEHIAFSPDGRWLAVTGPQQPAAGIGNTPHLVRLWETKAWTLSKTLRVHTEGIVSIDFSPDSERLVSASYHKGVIWDLLTGHELRSFEQVELIMRVAFSPDGRRLAAAGDDGTIVMIDADSGRPLSSLSKNVNVPVPLAFSPDGRWLVAGAYASLGPQRGPGPTVTFWDKATGAQVYSSTISVGGPRMITFSPDSRSIVVAASVYEDFTTAASSHLTLWDAPSGREVRLVWGRIGKEAALAVSFVPELRWLAENQTFQGYRYDPQPSSRIRPVLWPTGGHLFSFDHYLLASAAFSPDGRLLAAGDQNGTICVWDAATRRLLHRLHRWRPDCALSTCRVGSVAFSPDSRTLATQSGPDVRLWDTNTGAEMVMLRGHTTNVTTLAFSPNGRSLASGDDAGAVRVWEIPSGRAAATLAGHTQWVYGLSFSPDGRWLASSSKDGSIRIWGLATHEEAALLGMARGSRDWVVVTREGYFDGSMAGMQRLVAWRFENEAAPLEIFFSEFYYPGLLADVLAGKKPTAPRDIAQVDRRQPQVQLSLVGAQGERGPVGSRTVTVRVEVTEAPADAQRTAGSGARDLRLFRNGSLVKVWRGDVLQGRGSSVTLEASVPIVAGENRFTAYAFNRDNIKSADASLIVTGAPSLERRGTAYLLAIGINQYANPDYNLSYAVPDARAFAEELARQQTSLGSFASVEVIPLLDAEATKANILRALGRLAGTDTGPLPATSPLAKLKPAEPEDVVFVYYAGHGTAAGPRFYLIPHDLGYAGQRDQLDDAALQTILAHSLSDLDLEQAFEKVDAGRLLLVIDACNSGQALEAEEKRRGPMNSKGLAQLAYEKGMYILTAAQGYQAALEVAQLGHGLLTYALVEEGLKTPAADAAPSDGQVVVREWLDFATLRVPQLQQGAMEAARKVGRDVAFVEGEQLIQELEKRSLQRPRVFYRREPEPQPLIVARPPTN